MLIFSEIWANNGFFKVIAKIWCFSSKCEYFRSYGQEIKFQNGQKNVIFLEILIFLAIWANNDFFKLIQKIWCFFSKHEYFRTYGRKTIFSKIAMFDMCKKQLFSLELTYSDKKDFFKMISKQRLFLEILIFSAIR